MGTGRSEPARATYRAVDRTDPLKAPWTEETLVCAQRTPQQLHSASHATHSSQGYM